MRRRCAALVCMYFQKVSVWRPNLYIGIEFNDSLSYNLTRFDGKGKTNLIQFSSTKNDKVAGIITEIDN